METSKKISIALGDGFDTCTCDIDTVVMSGLGSFTIVDILKRGSSKINNINTLIISSNNDYYYLRDSICKLGFYVDDESIICERGKYYPIICFKKGIHKYSDYELLYGPVLLKNKDSVFIDYLLFLKNKYTNIISSLEDDNPKKKELSDKINFIDNYLEN